jgi:hypothetical protein
VILLPENLFYNTPAAGVIVVLSKRKPEARKGKIVLLDASRRFQKRRPKNHMAVDDLPLLAEAFHRCEAIEGDVTVITHEQAKGADYNLSPARWIRGSQRLEVSEIGSLADQMERLAASDVVRTDVLLNTLRRVSALSISESRASEESPPAGWEEGPLSAYIERPDYGYTESATTERIGPRFLRITDIQDGYVEWDGVPFCSCPPDVLHTKQLTPGDIVVARIGATTGKSFFIESCPQAVFASYLIRLRAKPDRLRPKYLYYYLQTEAYWTHIDRYKGDRLKGGVNIPVLESLPILIPPLVQQDRLIELLDTVQQKLTLVRESREVLDSLSHALLRFVESRNEAEALQLLLSSIAQPQVA